MTEKIVVMIGSALVLGTAGVAVLQDQLYRLRCERCVKPYAIFTRNGMGVCRGCKNAIDTLDSARATWFKRKRPAA